MKFLSEFKRRKVLNTASLYVVGVWILLQVLEVLQQFLPPGAMRWALIGAAVLYPIVFLAGWFFDISKEGITRTGPATGEGALPDPGFMDYVQLAGHALVIGFVGYALSMPPPAGTAAPAAGTAAQQRTIAVLAFEDLSAAGEGEDIGETFAGELRASLTRVAGLRVLGPETSRLLGLAGDGRPTMAQELGVTALLLGEVQLEAGQLSVGTRLLGVPGGNELWSSRFERPLEDAVEMQNALLRQMVAASAPGLEPDPVQGLRAEAGACASVYDLYLQGKRLSQARKHSQKNRYERGLELLREAVSRDESCALAWEALAVASVNHSLPGYVSASTAARRALEINEMLPEAWTVLAEIAENEQRWSDSEDYFLRALYADASSVRANVMYSQALVARGRARDALRYALEAYRYEPQSINVNNHVALAAIHSSDSATAIEHARKAIDLEGERNPFLLDSIAEAYLQSGETERALEIYREGGAIPDWFPDCVRARDDPELIPDVRETALKTFQDIANGLEQARWTNTWRLIRCGTWLGEPDITLGILLADDIDSPYFERKLPAELVFINLFIPDGAVLRQDPRFRKLVIESGLLAYWNEWGWADLCRPDGDSFACD